MPITINGSGTVTGLSVGGLPDGTVDADTLASSVTTGKVIQVVYATSTSQDQSPSGATTLTDMAPTASITPTANTSKIKITVSAGGIAKNCDDIDYILSRQKASTWTRIQGMAYYNNSTNPSMPLNWTMVFIDDPYGGSGTVGQLDYKVGIHVGKNESNLQFNYSGYTSGNQLVEEKAIMILEEIAG